MNRQSLNEYLWWINYYPTWLESEGVGHKRQGGLANHKKWIKRVVTEVSQTIDAALSRILSSDILQLAIQPLL